MRGEFIGVWSETWREIWLPLIDHEGVPDDVFCELYRALAPALKSKPSVEALADIIDNRVQSREAFEKTGSDDFAGERALVARSLNALESRLDPRVFFRANRRQIINLRWVQSIRPWFSRGLRIKLHSGSEIEISRRRSQLFRDLTSL